MNALSLQVKKFYIEGKPLATICTKTVGLTVLIYMKRARLLIETYPMTPQAYLYDVWFKRKKSDPDEDRTHARVVR